MKKLFLSFLTIIWASQTCLTAHASRVCWDPDQAYALAQAIVQGRRPPLSAAELADLDPTSKRLLLADLIQAWAQARQAKTPAVPDPPAGPASGAESDQGDQSALDQDDQSRTSQAGPAGGRQESGDDNITGPLPPLAAWQKDFLDQLAPVAQAAGVKYDLFPSVLIAQAALESNWGRSSLGRQYHNLFGIKGGGPFSVTLPTQEEAGAG